MYLFYTVFGACWQWPDKGGFEAEICGIILILGAGPVNFLRPPRPVLTQLWPVQLQTKDSTLPCFLLTEGPCSSPARAPRAHPKSPIIHPLSPDKVAHIWTPCQLRKCRRRCSPSRGRSHSVSVKCLVHKPGPVGVCPV